MKTINHLTQLISKHFSMHPAREETFINLIYGAISSSSVQHHKMARLVNSPNSHASIRKTERFFQKQELDMKDYAKVIECILNFTGKFDLCIDRSNWQFGEKSINYLVLSWRVSRFLSLPIFFIELDREGNSSIEQRIDIVENFSEVFGAERINSIMGDREFIGEKWIRFLDERAVPLYFRVRKNMLVSSEYGDIPIGQYFDHLKIGEFRRIEVEIYDSKFVFEGTQSEKSGLVIIMSNQISLKYGLILKKYKKRWSIEKLFKNLKSSGFNWENTHMKNSERLVKLLIILGFACVFVAVLGMQWANKIKWKKSVMCYEKTVFTEGLHELQHLMSRSIDNAIDILMEALSNAKSIFDKGTTSLQRFLDFQWF